MSEKWPRGKRSGTGLGLLVFGAVLAGVPAEAANFIVNSNLDTPDAVNDGVCLTGGGVCTLRAAIMESNFAGVANTIDFALPGPFSIAVGAAGLPAITRAVTINGYSQAGSSANTLPVGSNAVLLIELNGTATPNLSGINGLTLTAPTTVRGLVINRFAGWGIQVSPGGATSVIAGNYVGTNTAGTVALGNNRDGSGFEGGIGLTGGSTTIGGTAPADRNLVSGQTLNFSRGIELYDSSGNTIQGNYVGTNAAGTAALGNVGAGIGIDGNPGVGSDNNLIGGAVAGAGNLCSGGGTEGIYVSVDSGGNTIQGNTVGLNAAGTLPIPNGAEGIKLQSPGNTVGGDTPAKGNVVSGNGTQGVRIENNTAVGNAVLGNRIYGNGALGIDLVGDGVTNNDPLDGDFGPNNRLNFPVIDTVSVVGASLVVGFSLDVPAGSYRVEFFRNPSGVDVPNGEGEVFAGFQNVNHGGGGSRSFSATITGVSGDRITATTTLCTDGGVCAAFLDTSEFSANLIATPTNYRSIGTAANYILGTITVVNSSTTVTATGTTWFTSNRGRGDRIFINGVNYVVASVNSETSLTLTTPYAGVGASYSSPNYLIARQFTTLTAWEDCVDGPGGVACPFFPVASASLIADNRSEVGIAYDDVLGPDFAGGLVIDGATTDANHTITLTADGDNRHYGLKGQGVVIDNGASAIPAVSVFDDFVTVEWLEITGGGGTADGVRVNLLSPGTGSLITVRNNLIRNITGDGVALYDPDGRVDVVNNIVHSCTTGACSGIWLNSASLVAGSRFRVLNNTIYGCASGIAKAAGGAVKTLLLRNNISFGNTAFPDYEPDAPGSLDPASSHNLSEDATATAASPAGFAQTGVTLPQIAFGSTTVGSENLHIQSTSVARDAGANLSGVFTTDIDAALRPAPWDIGADEVPATALFRSVGITGTALASGAANALTISGSTATFVSGLPSIIGVGDAIQYDSDSDGSIDALAFIHGRTNSQTYTVKNKSGAAPTATATPDTDWAIYRAYTSLFAWETQNENGSISNAPVALRDFDTSTNLVTSNTTMHVACYGDGADTTPVTVAGWTTGINNYIRIYTPFAALDVGTSQRHSGTWNTTTAYRLQVASAPSTGILWLQANYVRVDGLQLWLTNDAFYPAVIYMNGATGVVSYDVSNNIVRGNGGAPSQPGRIGINTYVGGAAGSVARIWNNLVYDFTGSQTDVSGILLDDANFTHYVYNNTVADGGQGISQYQGSVVAKNNLVYNNTNNYTGTFNAASTNNLSGPFAIGAPGTNPRDAAMVTFVNAALDDFHLAGSDPGALNQGANLSADSNLAIFYDIDQEVRVPIWDIGADDASGTTAVKLLTFEAHPLDSALSLSWQTASELDNLGFHLYRAHSADGPYTRITSSVIPGLGSSPTGKSYSYRDGGLVNGRTYFYEMEDIDTSGQTKRHGPVSATPVAGANGDGGSDDSGGSGDGGGSGAGGSGGASGKAHGDAGAPSLRILERGPSYALLELRTPGFTAVSEPDGSVHLEVPGFELPQSPGSPAVPVKRTFVEALAGRGAHIASVHTEDLVGFSDLHVALEGAPEVVVTNEGLVRPGVAPRKTALGSTRGGYYPRAYARLLGTVFQGETKKARLELSPLRYDANTGQVVLARRLLVRLEFAGADPHEKSLGGSRGRRPLVGVSRSKGVVAQLVTKEAGLYKVPFDRVFPGAARGVPVSSLRLSRHGETVPFHIEPARALFAPGSFLYFVGGGDLNPNADMVYELERGRAGTSMTKVLAAPSGSDTSTYETIRLFEENHYYQAALLDAPDLWLWELLVSPVSKNQGFSLSNVDTGSTGHLKVWLQGASDFEADPDHHVRVSVNGSFVAEASWDGKREQVIESDLAPGVLQEGANTLTLESVGDTPAAYSMVFLNRFEVREPRNAVAEGGRLDGLFTQSGSAAVSGLPAGSLVLDTTSSPQWLTGGTAAAGIFRFRAEAGRHYLAVDPTAVLSPQVRSVSSGLRRTTLRADWLLLAPREFLSAAQPLVNLRREQGLVAKAVALEDVYQEFGFGEGGPEAIRAFLAYAFQSWKKPSPRYVVLLGDSTYDPKDYLGTHVLDRVPFYPVKTSFLWTASDPAYASVNGDDLVPDLAIGRLPAGSLAQAETLVGKLVAFERAGQTLDGKAVLVADNADLAGSFEADADDLSTSVLQGREVQKIYLRDLGASTRAEIEGAFDSGSSLLSYIGHGGTAVWASENVFNNQDVSALAAQARQPLLMTMNCLNGFFHFPPLNSLAEEFVKAEGKGAIAAFSPSGLSINAAAHLYHKAVLAEITQGNHPRLGDALLAAQSAYADSGSFPELLSIYHLFGDPAMKIR